MQRKQEDLSGRKYGRLTVVKRSEDRIRKSGTRVVRYECLCDCGKTCFVDAAELRKGATLSCGCLRKEINDNRAPNLVGKMFGFLLVKEKVESSKYGDCSMSKWKCECLNCGSTCNVLGTVLRRGQISCGCVNSKREVEIGKWLHQNNIKFEKQQYFDDLVSEIGRPYYFDFAVWINDEMILIEHQGEQHYKDESFGWYQRTISDPRKKEYCKQHNIKLLEIRFDDNIEEKLTVLYDNTVPSAAITAKV